MEVRSRAREYPSQLRAHLMKGTWRDSNRLLGRMGDMGGEDLMVRNAVSSWKQWVGQIDKTIGGFGDEELQ